jgi:hypothetical protein
MDGTSMDILSCLRKYGQRFDSEIASEVKMSLADVHTGFGRLSESGDVIACKVTRFESGTPVDSIFYRASGYFPKAAPGRKPKAPAP